MRTLAMRVSYGMVTLVMPSSRPTMGTKATRMMRSLMEGCTENNGAGDVLTGHFGGDPCLVEFGKEEPGEEGHGEGFDEPVDYEGEDNTFGAFPNLLDA